MRNAHGFAVHHGRSRFAPRLTASHSVSSYVCVLSTRGERMRRKEAQHCVGVCVYGGWGGLMPLLFMTHCTLFAFAAESESDGNTWVAIVVAPECVVSPRQYARTDGVV